MNITLNAVYPTLPINFHSACARYQQFDTKRSGEEMFFHQILLILDGKGVLYCREKEYTLEKGCAFYIAQGVEYYHRDLGELTSAFITVTGDAMELFSKHYAENGFAFWSLVNTDRWVERIQALIKEYTSSANIGRCSAMAYSFFVDFFEDSQISGSSLSEKVRLYIDKHFPEKLSLENLAHMAGISVSKLCRDFKASYGVTCFDYILNLRLEWARNYLIVNPSGLTKEAALLSGFEDTSYFCRAFKKKYGYNPRRSRSGER